MIAIDAPPETCALALKEWAGICRALAGGRQIVVLRKGGIAEGPGGFAPENPLFWLFPTRLHEGEQGLKDEARIVEDREGDPVVEIATLLKVEAVRRIDDLETLDRIDDEHLWTGETIRARFRYRTPGLWLMAVRASSTPDPFPLRPTAGQAGCRSWVELESPLPTSGLVPAIDDDEFEGRMRRLFGALEPRG